MCIKFQVVANNDTKVSDRYNCWENGIIYLVGFPLQETAQSVTTNSTCKTFLNSYMVNCQVTLQSYNRFFFFSYACHLP